MGWNYHQPDRQYSRIPPHKDKDLQSLAERFSTFASQVAINTAAALKLPNTKGAVLRFLLRGSEAKRVSGLSSGGEHHRREALLDGAIALRLQSLFLIAADL